MPADFKEELAWGKQFERVVAQEFLDAITKLDGSVALIDCQPTSNTDFCFIGDGILKGFIEVKARRVASTDYESVMVTVEKWNFGRFARAYLGVPTYCVVLYTDRVGYFHLEEPPDERAQKERGDRGTVAEHCFYQMTRINWLPEYVFRRIEEQAGTSTKEG